MRTSFNAVSDYCFSTMRVPVIAGRVFASTEAADPIVVVSHTFRRVRAHSASACTSVRVVLGATQISARDPLTFGATAVVLCAAALIACWIPAARALRVDPANALRQT
jgi:hypothetical protein